MPCEEYVLRCLESEGHTPVHEFSGRKERGGDGCSISMGIKKDYQKIAVKRLITSRQNG